MLAAGPLVEALHWAMLDFWAVLAAFTVAVFNGALVIRNQRRLDRIVKDLEEMGKLIKSRIEPEVNNGASEGESKGPDGEAPS